MNPDHPHRESDDDYRQALADGWLPIREVSRRTGVNPVTLRAWERRYGLVVPQRTPKGHRLYSEAQVSRIQAILTWLGRGVAVSKIRALLDDNAPLPLDTSASPGTTCASNASPPSAESASASWTNCSMARWRSTPHRHSANN